MKNILSIGEVSIILGVSISTLRRWDKNNKLKPKYRTIGNQRRYLLETIMVLIQPDFNKKKRYNILYSRVSSKGQENDLTYQKEVLTNYSRENKITNIKEISDLGSGINFKKKGLKELINLIINNKVDTIYLTTKDRLLRFGTELIISIAEEFNTKLKFIYEKEETFEETLGKDILEIITVFSSRLYGKRSHKNINQLKNNKQ